MLSYTIIYNPASGHAKGPTAAEQLKAKLEDRQRQVSMAPTKSADDALKFCLSSPIGYCCCSWRRWHD